MNALTLIARTVLCLSQILLVSACASGSSKPELPYPAFVQTDELPDIFMAALPGVRAKEYRVDLRTRAGANRVDIPRDWSGTTGGAPGKSLELFLLAGELRIADVRLGAGGYAYVPPGSLGFRMSTESGARVLYFLDDVDEESVIRAPIILDSQLLQWASTAAGVSEKTLRHDPGSGAKTWLLQLGVDADLPWESSSAAREGYLVAGDYQHSECDRGEVKTWQYLPGGYFRRPPNVLNGGPESKAATTATWFLRETRSGERTIADACTLQTAAE